MSGPVTAHTLALSLQRTFVDLSIFHDQLEAVLVIYHHFDVLQWIAIDNQQVGISTGLNDAHLLVCILLSRKLRAAWKQEVQLQPELALRPIVRMFRIGVIAN